MDVDVKHQIITDAIPLSGLSCYYPAVETAMEFAETIMVDATAVFWLFSSYYSAATEAVLATMDVAIAAITAATITSAAAKILLKNYDFCKC